MTKFDATQPSPSPASSSRAGRNLPVAIAVGVGLIGIVALTLWCFHWGFVIVEAIAFSLAALEIHRAFKRGGTDSSLVPVTIGSVLLVISPWINAELIKAGISTGFHSGTLILGALGLSVALALVWRMPRGVEGYLRDVAASLFTIAYVPLLGSFVTLMLAGSHGTLRVLFFILAVAASDIGGYTVGVLFGRHPMMPVISPKKTWEGFIGSLLGSAAVGAGAGSWLFSMVWWAGAIAGTILALFGVVGDLVVSMIKRDVGIKDMSNLIPGHGGLLDRIDSLLLAAPAAWLMLAIMVAGG